MRNSSTSTIPSTGSDVEIMALSSRISVTKGALMKLQGTLEFVKSGKDILKIKRERLAGELNTLFKELAYREEVEKHLMEVYDVLKKVMESLGYAEVLSMASSISTIQTEVIPVSIMGVVVPRIIVKEKPRIESIQDMSLYDAAVKLLALVNELLKLAEIEARAERISVELMIINRKVNALEKVIIPRYEREIKYMADLLFDEDLEDLTRIKHVRNVIGIKGT